MWRLVLFAAVIGSAMAGGMFQNAKGKMDVRIERIGTDCKDPKFIPANTVDDLIVDFINASSLEIGGIINIRKQVETSVIVKVFLSKCVFKNNKDSCETITSIKEEKVCAKLAKPGQVWTPLLQKIENFNPNCPIKKGVYKLEEGSITVPQVGNLPFMMGYWEVVLEAYNVDGDTLPIFCATVELEMKRAARVAW